MSQKALLLPSQGARFVIGERAIPTPADDQLLVKVVSAAINPVEWKIPKWGLFLTDKSYPAVLGTDIAGVVDKIGSAVTKFSPGDKVFFQGLYADSNQTGFQQYTLVPADLVSKIPPNVTEDEASTIPAAIVAGIVGLFHTTGLGIPPPFSGPTAPANASIFVSGGSSQVGQYGIQLARIAGFTNIVTTAAPKHAEWLKSYGATHVVDRSASDAAKQIRDIVGDELIYAFDAISSEETQLLSYSVLSDTKPGKLATVLPALSDKSKAAKKPEGKWNGIYGSSHTFRDISVPFWGKIYQWLEEGAIKPAKVRLLPGGLAAVQEGTELLEAGKVSGEKLVVRPWDT